MQINNVYPTLLANQLRMLPLEPYEPGRGPTFLRVPSRMLTADQNRMAVKGWEHHEVTDALWAESYEASIRPPSFSLRWTQKTSAPQADGFNHQAFGFVYDAAHELPGSVPVVCRVVGLPPLLEPPTANADLFSSIVLRGDPLAIEAEVMRATIAFKWQAFGFKAWLYDLSRYAIFCGCCIPGQLLLTRSR